MHLTAARASAAGFAGHAFEVRGLDWDVASRHEAYNNLNTGLQGALQWLCNLWTRALPGPDRRAVASGMPQSGLKGHACPAAACEHAPAPHESARRSSTLRMPCRMSHCECAAC